MYGVISLIPVAIFLCPTLMLNNTLFTLYYRAWNSPSLFTYLSLCFNISHINEQFLTLDLSNHFVEVAAWLPRLDCYLRRMHQAILTGYRWLYFQENLETCLWRPSIYQLVRKQRLTCVQGFKWSLSVMGWSTIQQYRKHLSELTRQAFWQAFWPMVSIGDTAQTRLT